MFNKINSRPDLVSVPRMDGSLANLYHNTVFGNTQTRFGDLRAHYGLVDASVNTVLLLGTGGFENMECIPGPLARATEHLPSSPFAC